MRARVVVLFMGLLVAACGSPTGTVSSEPTVVASSAEASRAPAESASAPTASAGAFTVCPSAAEGPTCPLPPGDYTAPVHDAFSFKIDEAGWQEERQVAGEFETRIVLSRTDEPGQRLTFLSGLTGAASPAIVNAAAFAVAGFKAGQPTDVTISGTPAQYIDLEPVGAQAAATVTIDDQTVTLEPDRRYRFTLAKIPMDQEAATVIIVTEAPTDTFATFVQTADKVVQSVRF
jgi:hypothetical protein